MQFNKFKLTAIALAVAGIPAAANAYLYEVTLLDAPSSNSSQATAISADGAQVAVEGLSGPVGLDYSQQLLYMDNSQELPYMVDVEHYINSLGDLEDYCNDYLGYNTCGTWANVQWYGVMASDEEVCKSDTDLGCEGGLKKEIDAWDNGYTSNSTAEVAGAPINPFGSLPAPVIGGLKGAPKADSTNVIVNAIVGGTPVGSSSSPYFDEGSYYARAFQRRGFYGYDELLPPQGLGDVITAIGQTNANGAVDVNGTTIVFGSASVANMADVGNGNKVPEGSGLGSLSGCSIAVDYSDRACQYFQFANQAAVWLPGTNNIAREIASFPSGTSDGAQTAQASVRGAAVQANSAPALVGFNTYRDGSNFYARAVKFNPVQDFDTCLSNSPSLAACWKMDPVSTSLGSNLDDDSFSYSVATDVNSSGTIIGIAKYRASPGGVHAENIFVGGMSQDTYTLLGPSQSKLFFNGYNATAAAINNANEVVGKVDVENSRDRARRQRGYIYLHGNAENLPAFNNTRGWLLDDLTNGAPNANQYRIAEAFDIAENGDIAASAFYCAGGYSSTAHDALCNGTEELVAVKLTRTAGDVTPRGYTETSISRSGGNIGLLGLGLIALAGFFRRKK